MSLIKQNNQGISKKITIFDNVAYNNPDAAYALLKKYGHKGKFKNQDEMAKQLVNLYKLKGKKVFGEIVELHPDKALFEEIYSNAGGKEQAPTAAATDTVSANTPPVKPPVRFNNACGCALGADGGNADVQEYSNCAGNPNCPCNKTAKGVVADNNFSSADGDKTKLPAKEGFYTPTNMLILTGIVLLCGTIIYTSK